MRPVETREFRDALGCFATGLTVVTTTDGEGRPVGFTANSFNAVSLNPPLVLFSLDRSARCLADFVASAHFAVNVLREDQRRLSDQFASSTGDRWAGVDYVAGRSGCPILPDAIANFDCRVHRTYDGGDHLIFVGEVLQLACDFSARPLLYCRGTYRGLAEAE